MPRIANQTATVRIPAADVHNLDILLGKAGGELTVDRAYTLKGQRVIKLMGAQRWTVPADYEVTARAEQDCGKCMGKGVFYGRGVVENGVFKGTTGPCFGCNGKGWMDRSDVIRNETYFRKYVRVYA